VRESQGGKASNFEGGIRVNAFVSGGFVPATARGKKLGGLGTLWDWYGTFAALAGVSPHDGRASRAGLPAVDSVNLWPYISGETNSSARTSIALGSSSCVFASPKCINEWGAAPSQTTVDGLIVDKGEGGLWKILVGWIPMNGWQGTQYPNASTLSWAAEASIATCDPGCLFRLDTDPTEHVDLATSKPQILQRMLSLLKMHNTSVFSPDRGTPDIDGACKAAMERYSGFWGPWVH